MKMLRGFVLLFVGTALDALQPPTPKGRIPSRPTAGKELDELVSDLCRGTNEFWEGLVLPAVREKVRVAPSGTAALDPLSIFAAAPEVPGIPRPAWVVILLSAPTALAWYGYYKFSIEEELFQWELRTHPKGFVSGCGGYGTLFPFVYGVLLGTPLAALNLPLGQTLLQLAAAWILLGQLNLYRRVNDLLPEPPLHAWWVFLPPPLDVVVGLRQVHFLSVFWHQVRGDEPKRDVVAEDLFPFIARMPRFTLKEFARTPSMWFWFTRDWPDLTFSFLQED